MTVDAWAALAGVAALVLTAIAGLTKAVADLITAWRRPDKTPAPEVGIPAVAEHEEDDIDFRAFERMEADRDYWRDLYLGKNPHPDPGQPGPTFRKDTP
ncbi:MAG: hypothetical protein K0S37_1327 [Microbacterium sp.]|jgi:hypothetical protein|nr:hypothetical protein [Microbacterium sp.]